MIIRIKKISPDATLPVYAHAGDAGMDLFAVEDCALEAGDRVAVGTGVTMQIPDGFVGLIWDKSGRAFNEGLKTLAGVVDAGYRGEVKVGLVNLGREPIHIKKHQKIAQMLIQPVISPTLTEVEELEQDTSRGANGFGSTGLV